MLANNFNVGDKFTYGDYGLITVIEIQEEIRCINKNIKIEQDGKQFMVLLFMLMKNTNIVFVPCLIRIDCFQEF